MDELREEHGGEEGLLAEVADDKGKISKAALFKRLRELSPLSRWRGDGGEVEEYEMLQQYKKLMDDESDIQGRIKTAKAELEKKVISQYPSLSIQEIKTIVVEKKWMANMELRIHTEMDNISHRLTQRIKELAERYETTLPVIAGEVDVLANKVSGHLKNMGFVWK